MTDSDQLERVARAIEAELQKRGFTLLGSASMPFIARAAISAMSPPPEQKPSEEAMRRARKLALELGAKLQAELAFQESTWLIGLCAREFDRVAADERKACASIARNKMISSRSVEFSDAWNSGVLDCSRETAAIILSRTGCPKGDANA